MIVLDTNVVSEGFRPFPHAAVQSWMNVQNFETLYICAPVLAEIRFGIALLQDGSSRRAALQNSVDILEFERFAERILPFDAAAAKAYAKLSAARQRSGRPIGAIDGFIAAIATSHGADIATRDVSGFSGLGLTIINPFKFIA